MPTHWYVLRAQSGKEEQVKDNLDRRVRSRGLEDVVLRILVPSENVSEIRAGTKRVTERRIYPGYIMAEIDVDESGRVPDDVWFLIRETPGVGDFVGGQDHPMPMTQREVDKILGEAERKEETPKLKITVKIGDSVKIKEGPFENFDGIVKEVQPTKGLVNVVVTIFGRATPVELEYWQVESI